MKITFLLLFLLGCGAAQGEEVGAGPPLAEYQRMIIIRPMEDGSVCPSKMYTLTGFVIPSGYVVVTEECVKGNTP